MATRSRRPQPRTIKSAGGAEDIQTDYMEHGSEMHATMLGLRKARESDACQVDGYAFADITKFGPAAQQWYIQQRLEQCVAELKTAPSAPQSEDRYSADYAPRMFDPDSKSVRIVGAV